VVPPVVLPSCISSNSEGSKKLPDYGRLLPKHVGASISNKEVVQTSAKCWLFLLNHSVSDPTIGASEWRVFTKDTFDCGRLLILLVT
jgi:hypothetical protein